MADARSEGQAKTSQGMTKATTSNERSNHRVRGSGLVKAEANARPWASLQIESGDYRPATVDACANTPLMKAQIPEPTPATARAAMT
jgi:hypothetical protein